MTRIAIPALALAAALGLAACEKASTAAPASQARPATTTTTVVEATTTAPSVFAGVTARSGGDLLFAEYLQSEGNSIDFDVARAIALKTCDLLDEGTSPDTVIYAGAMAAMENDVDAKDAGQVMGAGVEVYCPEHGAAFQAASEALVARTR